MTDFEFIEIACGHMELGWRFDHVLPKNAVESMSEFAFGNDFRTLFFSPRRSRTIPPFKIATIAVPWNALFTWDEFGPCQSLHEECRKVDSRLAKDGWRLPTEDEFEIAVGGDLFAWGNEIPDGIPSGKHTTFSKHKNKTSCGLRLNDNPYNVELVSTALKMGDGGVSICGGNDWPIAWLSLSPSYRTPKELYETALPEYLEPALVRPVLL
jgi:hypothetical protein